MTMKNKPAEHEYGGHFGIYIRLVPEGNILDILDNQRTETLRLLAEYAESGGDYRYAADKWSLKEVFGHITDTERIMAYRLLRIARGDATPLPGFDQDLFMRHSPFGSWSMAQLAEDYGSIRNSTLNLLRGLPEDAWSRKGTASETGITVRALAHVIAGHERHHIAIIREKYLR